MMTIATILSVPLVHALPLSTACDQGALQSFVSKYIDDSGHFEPVICPTGCAEPTCDNQIQLIARASGRGVVGSLLQGPVCQTYRKLAYDASSKTYSCEVDSVYVQKVGQAAQSFAPFANQEVGLTVYHGGMIGDSESGSGGSASATAKAYVQGGIGGFAKQLASVGGATLTELQMLFSLSPFTTESDVSERCAAPAMQKNESGCERLGCKWQSHAGTPAGVDCPSLSFAECEAKACHFDSKYQTCTAIAGYTSCASASKPEYQYLADPKWLAENFLEYLDGLDLPKPSAGLVPYLRPKDSGYRYNVQLDGGGNGAVNVTKPPAAGCLGYVGPAVLTRLQDGRYGFDPELHCDGVEDECAAEEAAGACSGVKGCVWKDSGGCQLDPSVCFHVPFSYPDNCLVCPRPEEFHTNDCSKVPACAAACKAVCGLGSEEPGCPNIASQVLEYMSDVNAAAKPATAVKLRALVADGEDLGLANNTWKLFESAADKYGPSGVAFGYAKSISAHGTGRTSFPNEAMPETYWYMNELWPCVGNEWQMQHKDATQVCTGHTSYSYFKNKPADFLAHLELSSANDGASKVAGRAPHDGLAALRQAPSAAHPDAYTAAQKAQTLPMFSLENLSLEGDASTCIAKALFGRGVASAKPQICGTFDGFSHWDLPQFYAFLQLFASRYEFPRLGVYESQFVGPNWIEMPSVPSETF